MKFSFILTVALVLAAGTVARADILLQNGVQYTQDFNTMSSATTGTTSSLMPADWSFVDPNSLYTNGAGGTATGDTYNYGVDLSTDRSIGGLSTVAFSERFGAEFQNAGDSHLTKVSQLTYTGEQWRLGATGRVDRLDFQYSTDATSLTTGTWFDINVLDFTAPVTTGATGSRVGNSAPNFTVVSLAAGPPFTQFVFATSVAPGGTFWIRWTGIDATSADDGLSIDDFSITAIPEPSSMALCGILVGIMGFSLVRRRQRLAK